MWDSNIYKMDIFLFDCQIITKNSHHEHQKNGYFDFSLVEKPSHCRGCFEAMFIIEDNKRWWVVINIWSLSEVILWTEITKNYFRPQQASCQMMF